MEYVISLHEILPAWTQYEVIRAHCFSFTKNVVLFETNTTLPINLMGLSLTYRDLRCAVRGELITVTYHHLPFYIPHCCDTLSLQALTSFFSKDGLTTLCLSTGHLGYRN
jgi:hypothetical protein